MTVQASFASAFADFIFLYVSLYVSRSSSFIENSNSNLNSILIILQLALAPWWLDPLMWVGHVLFLAIFVKLILMDPGVLKARDGTDEKQMRRVEDLIVELAENGKVPRNGIKCVSLCLIS